MTRSTSVSTSNFLCKALIEWQFANVATVAKRDIGGEYEIHFSLEHAADSVASERRKEQLRQLQLPALSDQVQRGLPSRLDHGALEEQILRGGVHLTQNHPAQQLDCQK